VVGQRFTAVRLEDGSVGLSFSLGGRGCSFEPGSLRGMTAKELVGYLLSPSPVDSSVGLATANAFNNARVEGTTGRDALDLVEVSKSDFVATIGFFPPYSRVLKERAKGFAVLDDREVHSEVKSFEVYPWWSFTSIVPKADLLIITGSSVANKTVDTIVSHAKKARAVVVTGPSTPMLPEAFKGTKVKVLAGAKVRDGERAMRVVEESGGTADLYRGACEKVSLRL